MLRITQDTTNISISNWFVKLIDSFIVEKREVKMIRILEPQLNENFEFIAGPAQFGPDLGGDAQFQVSTSQIVT